MCCNTLSMWMYRDPEICDPDYSINTPPSDFTGRYLIKSS